MSIAALPVGEFAAALASSQATPGGGAAAALAGALAVSLGAMSARCSASWGEEAQFSALLARAETLRKEFLSLIDADAEAYRAYAAAKAAAKTDPSCAADADKALLAAAQPPLAVLRFACEEIELLEQILPRCKKALWPDVAVAAALARGTICAAAVTVRANTADGGAAAQLLQETEHALAAYLLRADALYASASGQE